MTTADRTKELAKELYGTSLNNLSYQQQAIVATLVAAEIHALALRDSAVMGRR